MLISLDDWGIKPQKITYEMWRDQKELLEATAQYRKLLIPDLIIKGVGLILSLIVYPPIMMYSVLIAAFYIITLKTLSEKRVNN